ncbi:polyamine aminopropyltransferase [Persicobacter diffluens]|uniref:Polyamine aminopropyltransferase n=1 Tax=Persicobacter diffluens TaxID=981 RepID=A0AAN4VVQ8_9BACT|nr:polyamine aminopropyltransferase 2 [Persicobacter diffluens]
MTKDPIFSRSLKIALFATGLSGIVAEYVLSTLASYFLGDSVIQFTLIVSLMLFAMGLGSRISRRFDEDLLATFISLEYILSFLVTFASLIAYGISLFPALTAVVIYGLSIVIGLLIGMEIPLVIRMNDAYEELKVNVSNIMENDYYGSLLGGIFFAFIGRPYLGLTYTPFVLGMVNFAVAFWLFYLLKGHLKSGHLKKLRLASLFVMACWGLGLWKAGDIIAYGEQQRYADRVIFDQQTNYQRIVMTENKGEYWLFLNGNQQLSTLDEVPYHEAIVHPMLSQLKQPKDILILGGGDGCAVREVLKYPSVQNITLVDLDPAMTELAMEHPVMAEINQNAMKDPRVTVINGDGYTFLADHQNYYDGIIVDLPDPKNVDIGRLYSVEFYKLCYKHLRPDGLLVTQAGSPYYAEKAFHCIDLSFQQAGFNTLPYHTHLITLGEWGWILGSKNIPQEKMKEAFGRLDYPDEHTHWFNQSAMLMMMAFGKSVFKEDLSQVKPNYLHHPTLYKYYLDGRWELY